MFYQQEKQRQLKFENIVIQRVYFYIQFDRKCALYFCSLQIFDKIASEQHFLFTKIKVELDQVKYKFSHVKDWSKIIEHANFKLSVYTESATVYTEKNNKSAWHFQISGLY